MFDSHHDSCMTQVLVRSELNVKLKDNKVKDDTRIRTSLPTIKYLLDNGARVAIAAHLGRPKGTRKTEFSLAPVAEHISTLIGQVLLRLTLHKTSRTD
jgi:phosphoglycerate kinase